MAECLVAELSSKYNETSDRVGWSKQNFSLLEQLDWSVISDGKVRKEDVQHFPSRGPDVEPKDRKGEFLWDHIAYVQGKGILLAAESEWLAETQWEMEYDFEKLLYVRSPMKLFLGRISTKKQAPSVDALVKDLRKYMTKVASSFGPGEVFIVYFRGWQQDNQGESNDRAYILQVPGDFSDISVPENLEFKLVSTEKLEACPILT